jgi:hypothetical protein
MSEDAVPGRSAQPLQPEHGRSWRLPLLLAAVLVALAGAGGLLLWYRHAPASALSNDVSGEELAAYLPEDAALVAEADVRRLQRSSAFVRLAERQLLAQVPRSLVQRRTELLGVHFAEDVDRLRLVASAHGLARPLLLFRGRFDVGRFQVGRDRLRPLDEPGPDGRQLHLLEDRPQGGPAAWLAAADGCLLYSEARERVTAALAAAARRQPPAPRDARLRAALEAVDRRQTLWLAVSLEGLGPVPRLPDSVHEMVLRPVLTHAAAVYGGLTLTDEAHLRLVFRCRDDRAATELEQQLQNICDVARGVLTADLAPPDAVPVVRLVAAGQVRRDGVAVTLEARASP